MTETPLPDVEITVDNFADFLPAEPEPLADTTVVLEAVEPNAEDVPDDEILADDAEEIDEEDTLTDDAALWIQIDAPDPTDTETDGEIDGADNGTAPVET